MSIKKSLLITLSTMVLFIGCSSHSNHFSPFICEKIDLSTNRDNIIIHDFITIVKAYYSPATTIFQIETNHSEFSKKIENALRQKGYGLGAIYGKGLQQIPLAWKITYLNKKMIRVTYNISNATISRIYQLKQNQYYPYSSFSAIGLDSQKFANLDFSNSNSILLESSPKSTPSLAKVTANSLKIRSKPTTHSKEIAIIKKGETISYIEITTNNQGEEWVKLEGGGYMKASYLRF